MDKPVLLAIHGVSGAGKDTTARFIKELAADLDPALTTCKRGFADKAKLAWARQFFPTIDEREAIEWVDKYKNSERTIVFPLEQEHDGVLFHAASIPFRLCMAQFATEGGREIYGDDHWVNQLLPTGMVFDRNDLPVYPRWHENFEDPTHSDPEGPRVAQICIISDFRFANEAERIKQLGYAIKVRRKDAEQAVLDEAEREGRAKHISEMGLPDNLFDIVINNDDNNMENARERTSSALSMILRWHAHRGYTIDRPGQGTVIK